MTESMGRRLELYTINRPQEVLIVTAQIAGVDDQITIYKGFSSSLMRPTSFDPDVAILPSDAEIITIDRVASPYNPDEPRYLQQGLSRETMEKLLVEMGV